MTREITTCCPNDSLREVWATMKNKGLKSVPIVDAERRPIGLVLAGDALEMLLSKAEYEGELLKGYVNSVGYH